MNDLEHLYVGPDQAQFEAPRFSAKTEWWTDLGEETSVIRHRNAQADARQKALDAKKAAVAARIERELQGKAKVDRYAHVKSVVGELRRGSQSPNNEETPYSDSRAASPTGRKSPVERLKLYTPSSRPSSAQLNSPYSTKPRVKSGTVAAASVIAQKGWITASPVSDASAPSALVLNKAFTFGATKGAAYSHAHHRVPEGSEELVAVSTKTMSMRDAIQLAAHDATEKEKMRQQQKQQIQPGESQSSRISHSLQTPLVEEKELISTREQAQAAARSLGLTISTTTPSPFASFTPNTVVPSSSVATTLTSQTAPSIYAYPSSATLAKNAARPSSSAMSTPMDTVTEEVLAKDKAHQAFLAENPILDRSGTSLPLRNLATPTSIPTNLTTANSPDVSRVFGTSQIQGRRLYSRMTLEEPEATLEEKLEAEIREAKRKQQLQQQAGGNRSSSTSPARSRPRSPAKTRHNTVNLNTPNPDVSVSPSRSPAPHSSSTSPSRPATSSAGGRTPAPAVSAAAKKLVSSPLKELDPKIPFDQQVPPLVPPPESPATQLWEFRELGSEAHHIRRTVFDNSIAQRNRIDHKKMIEECVAKQAAMKAQKEMNAKHGYHAWNDANLQSKFLEGNHDPHAAGTFTIPTATSQAQLLSPQALNALLGADLSSTFDLNSRVGRETLSELRYLQGQQIELLSEQQTDFKSRLMRDFFLRDARERIEAQGEKNISDIVRDCAMKLRIHLRYRAHQLALLETEHFKQLRDHSEWVELEAEARAKNRARERQAKRDASAAAKVKRFAVTTGAHLLAAEAHSEELKSQRIAFQAFKTRFALYNGAHSEMDDPDTVANQQVPRNRLQKRLEAPNLFRTLKPRTPLHDPVPLLNEFESHRPDRPPGHPVFVYLTSFRPPDHPLEKVLAVSANAMKESAQIFRNAKQQRFKEEKAREAARVQAMKADKLRETAENLANSKDEVPSSPSSSSSSSSEEEEDEAEQDQQDSSESPKNPEGSETRKKPKKKKKSKKEKKSIARPSSATPHIQLRADDPDAPTPFKPSRANLDREELTRERILWVRAEEAKKTRLLIREKQAAEAARQEKLRVQARSEVDEQTEEDELLTLGKRLEAALLSAAINAADDGTPAEKERRAIERVEDEIRAKLKLQEQVSTGAVRIDQDGNAVPVEKEKLEKSRPSVTVVIKDDENFKDPDAPVAHTSIPAAPPTPATKLRYDATAPYLVMRELEIVRYALPTGTEREKRIKARIQAELEQEVRDLGNATDPLAFLSTLLPPPTPTLSSLSTSTISSPELKNSRISSSRLQSPALRVRSNSVTSSPGKSPGGSSRRLRSPSVNVASPGGNSSKNSSPRRLSLSPAGRTPKPQLATSSSIPSFSLDALSTYSPSSAGGEMAHSASEPGLHLPLQREVHRSDLQFQVQQAEDVLAIAEEEDEALGDVFEDAAARGVVSPNSDWRHQGDKTAKAGAGASAAQRRASFWAATPKAKSNAGATPKRHSVFVQGSNPSSKSPPAPGASLMSPTNSAPPRRNSAFVSSSLLSPTAASASRSGQSSPASHSPRGSVSFASVIGSLGLGTSSEARTVGTAVTRSPTTRSPNSTSPTRSPVEKSPNDSPSDSRSSSPTTSPQISHGEIGFRHTFTPTHGPTADSNPTSPSSARQMLSRVVIDSSFAHSSSPFIKEEEEGEEEEEHNNNKKPREPIVIQMTNMSPISEAGDSPSSSPANPFLKFPTLSVHTGANEPGEHQKSPSISKPARIFPIPEREFVPKMNEKGYPIKHSRSNISLTAIAMARPLLRPIVPRMPALYHTNTLDGKLDKPWLSGLNIEPDLEQEEDDARHLALHAREIQERERERQEELQRSAPNSPLFTRQVSATLISSPKATYTRMSLIRDKELSDRNRAESTGTVYWPTNPNNNNANNNASPATPVTPTSFVSSTTKAFAAVSGILHAKSKLLGGLRGLKKKWDKVDGKLGEGTVSSNNKIGSPMAVPSASPTEEKTTQAINSPYTRSRTPVRDLSTPSGLSTSRSIAAISDSSTPTATARSGAMSFRSPMMKSVKILSPAQQAQRDSVSTVGGVPVNPFYMDDELPLSNNIALFQSKWEKSKFSGQKDLRKTAAEIDDRERRNRQRAEANSPSRKPNNHFNATAETPTMALLHNITAEKTLDLHDPLHSPLLRLKRSQHASKVITYSNLVPSDQDQEGDEAEKEKLQAALTAEQTTKNQDIITVSTKSTALSGTKQITQSLDKTMALTPRTLARRKIYNSKNSTKTNPLSDYALKQWLSSHRKFYKAPLMPQETNGRHGVLFKSISATDSPFKNPQSGVNSMDSLVDMREVLEKMFQRLGGGSGLSTVQLRSLEKKFLLHFGGGQALTSEDLVQQKERAGGKNMLLSSKDASQVSVNALGKVSVKQFVQRFLGSSMEEWSKWWTTQQDMDSNTSKGRAATDPKTLNESLPHEKTILPLPLWVPAFHRLKILDRLMAHEKDELNASFTASSLSSSSGSDLDLTDLWESTKHEVHSRLIEYNDSSIKTIELINQDEQERFAKRLHRLFHCTLQSTFDDQREAVLDARETMEEKLVEAAHADAARIALEAYAETPAGQVLAKEERRRRDKGLPVVEPRLPTREKELPISRKLLKSESTSSLTPQNSTPKTPNTPSVLRSPSSRALMVERPNSGSAIRASLHTRTGSVAGMMLDAADPMREIVREKKQALEDPFVKAMNEEAERLITAKLMLPSPVASPVKFPLEPTEFSLLSPTSSMARARAIVAASQAIAPGTSRAMSASVKKRFQAAQEFLPTETPRSTVNDLVPDKKKFTFSIVENDPALDQINMTPPHAIPDTIMSRPKAALFDVFDPIRPATASAVADYRSAIVAANEHLRREAMERMRPFSANDAAVAIAEESAISPGTPTSQSKVANPLSSPSGLSKPGRSLSMIAALRLENLNKLREEVTRREQSGEGLAAPVDAEERQSRRSSLVRPLNAPGRHLPVPQQRSPLPVLIVDPNEPIPTDVDLKQLQWAELQAALVICAQPSDEESLAQEIIAAATGSTTLQPPIVAATAVASEHSAAAARDLSVTVPVASELSVIPVIAAGTHTPQEIQMVMDTDPQEEGASSSDEDEFSPADKQKALLLRQQSSQVDSGITKSLPEATNQVSENEEQRRARERSELAHRKMKSDTTSFGLSVDVPTESNINTIQVVEPASGVFIFPLRENAGTPSALSDIPSNAPSIAPTPTAASGSSSKATVFNQVRRSSLVGIQDLLKQAAGRIEAAQAQVKTMGVNEDAMKAFHASLSPAAVAALEAQKEKERLEAKAMKDVAEKSTGTSSNKSVGARKNSILSPNARGHKRNPSAPITASHQIKLNH